MPTQSSSKSAPSPPSLGRRRVSQVRFSRNNLYAPEPDNTDGLYNIPPNQDTPYTETAYWQSQTRRPLPEIPVNAAQNVEPNHQYYWRNEDALNNAPIFIKNHVEQNDIVDERRGSDKTLTDIAGELGGQSDYPAKPPNVRIYNGAGNGIEKSKTNRNNPPLHSALPVHRYRNPTPQDHKKKDGLYRRLVKAAKKLVADQEIVRETRPATYLSRQRSWAGNMSTGRAPQNNFEQSLAINAEDEDTYLYQDETSNPLQVGRTASIPRRSSYAQRRKQKKHLIKFFAEDKTEYEKFIITFSKSLLVFGSPSHRIEAQLNSLARVFDIEAQFLHTTGTVQVSFGNPETKGSVTCLVKSNIGLSLGRIHAIHNIYRAVLHDEMPSSEGSRCLKKLLDAPPRYGTKTRFVLSFITSFLICGIAFGGSLNDMWVAGIAGFLVRVIQNFASKSKLSASGSEVFTAAIVSLIARGLASYPSQIWCYTGISSAGVISLLPGFLILAGSLDIAGKNIALGSPKIVSGIMTSLYLGFGLTLGSDVFLLIDKPARAVLEAAATVISEPTILAGTFNASNSTSPVRFNGTFSFVNASQDATPANVINGCYRDPSWGWYLQPIPWWSLFICVPIFTFCASMNNQQHWYSRQMVVMVVIACLSFLITRLANLHWGLSNHPDYVALIGSFVIGLLGNAYSRRFGGTAFTAMLTGILLLVPDGLSAAGGLSDNYTAPGQDEYTQSLNLARKMISVVIGIMSGVYISAAIIYLFGKKKNAALVTF